MFKEYENKNLAIVLIEETNSKNDQKILIRTRILWEKIDKTIIVEKIIKVPKILQKKLLK